MWLEPATASSEMVDEIHKYDVLNKLETQSLKDAIYNSYHKNNKFKPNFEEKKKTSTPSLLPDILQLYNIV